MREDGSPSTIRPADLLQPMRSLRGRGRLLLRPASVRARAEAIGERIRSRLEEFAAQSDLAAEVRGLGPMSRAEGAAAPLSGWKA